MAPRAMATDVAEARVMRAANRRVSDQLLARLVKFHGNNPPNDGAAAFVAAMRKHVRTGKMKER